MSKPIHWGAKYINWKSLTLGMLSSKTCQSFERVYTIRWGSALQECHLKCREKEIVISKCKQKYF